MEKAAVNPTVSRFLGEGAMAAGVLSLFNVFQGEGPVEAVKSGLKGGLAWGTIGAGWPHAGRIPKAVKTFLGRRKRADLPLKITMASFVETICDQRIRAYNSPTKDAEHGDS